MPERAIFIRIGIKDRDKVRRALNDVGVDFDKALGRVDKRFDGISKSTRGFDRNIKGVRSSLTNLGATINIIDGPLGGVASRFNTFNAAVGRSGLLIAGLAGGVAVGVGALSVLARAGAESERQLFQLEAQLNATGGASLKTALELSTSADAIAKATLANVEGARAAQGVLLAQGNIAGDIFDRALEGSQDLAAVFGGDLPSNARILAQALTDPEEGLSRLNRRLKLFTEAEEEAIAVLIKTGQTVTAQDRILDRLESRIGGTGAAASQGIAGAADFFAQEWSELLAELGRTPGVGGRVTNALNFIAGALEGVRRQAALSGVTASPLVSDEELLAQQEAQFRRSRFTRVLRPLVTGGGVFPNVGGTELANIFLPKPEDVEAAIEATRERIAEAGRTEAERAAKEEEQLRSNAEEAFTAIVEEGADARLKLRGEEAERLRKQAEDDIALLEQFRAGNRESGVGIDDARIDAAIADRRALLELQLSETPARRQAAAAIERQRDADAALVESLEFELAQLMRTDDQQRVHANLAKLSALATDDQRDSVRRLTEELIEQENARADSELIDALEVELDLMRLSAVERDVEIEMRKLSADATDDQRLAVEGLVRAKHAEREAQRRLSEAEREAEADARNFAGIITDIGREANRTGDFLGALTNGINRLQEAFLEAAFFRPLEDALFAAFDPTAGGSAIIPVDVARSQGVSAGEAAAEGAISGLQGQRPAIVSAFQNIFSSVAGIVSGIFSAIFGGIGFGGFGGGAASGGVAPAANFPPFQRGGPVTRSAPKTMRAPVSVFAGAPHFRTGGPVNAGAAIPAFLHEGERVLNAQENSKFNRLAGELGVREGQSLFDRLRASPAVRAAANDDRAGAPRMREQRILNAPVEIHVHGVSDLRGFNESRGQLAAEISEMIEFQAGRQR